MCDKTPKETPDEKPKTCCSKGKCCKALEKAARKAAEKENNAPTVKPEAKPPAPPAP